MARIYSSGFELQSVTTGVEADAITGSPTIDTTAKRSGAVSLGNTYTDKYTSTY